MRTERLLRRKRVNFLPKLFFSFPFLEGSEVRCKPWHRNQRRTRSIARCEKEKQKKEKENGESLKVIHFLLFLDRNWTSCVSSLRWNVAHARSWNKSWNYCEKQMESTLLSSKSDENQIFFEQMILRRNKKKLQKKREEKRRERPLSVLRWWRNQRVEREEQYNKERICEGERGSWVSFMAWRRNRLFASFFP